MNKLKMKKEIEDLKNRINRLEIDAVHSSDFYEIVNSESFIDGIIARINKKQLKK